MSAIEGRAAAANAAIAFAVGEGQAGHLRAQKLHAALAGPAKDPGELVLQAFDEAVAIGGQHLLSFARGIARAMVRS